MDNFEIISNYRLRLSLWSSDPKAFLTTPEGIRYSDPKVCSPGVSNTYHLARKWCVGKGLDVGASYFQGSTSNGFPGATPVDLAIPGSGRAEALVQGTESQDYVFMSHVLEHLDDPEAAIREAHRVLRPWASLFTYGPYPGHPDWDPSLSAEVRGPGGHKWQPSPTSVCRLLAVCGFQIVYSEWEPDHLHSFVVVGAKVP